MASTTFIRRILWISALFNIGGAVLFAFPASALGQFAGMPVDVPVLYRAFVTLIVLLFVLLFGGMYAWLAMQPVVHRPIVTFAAIGKSSAFVLMLVLWMAGETSLRSVQVITGDLLLAAVYLHWLRRTA